MGSKIHKLVRSLQKNTKIEKIHREMYEQEFFQMSFLAKYLFQFAHDFNSELIKNWVYDDSYDEEIYKDAVRQLSSFAVVDEDEAMWFAKLYAFYKKLNANKNHGSETKEAEVTEDVSDDE